MMGTFAAVLAKSRVRTTEKDYRAEVSGDIEAVNGVLKITRIHVQYYLSAPAEKHDAIHQAFSSYITGCPAAQSVVNCIDITHDLQLT